MQKMIFKRILEFKLMIFKQNQSKIKNQANKKNQPNKKNEKFRRKYQRKIDFLYKRLLI